MSNRAETRVRLREAADTRRRVRALVERSLAADKATWRATTEESAFLGYVSIWAGVPAPTGEQTAADGAVGFLWLAEHALNQAVNRLIHELAGTVTVCSECGKSVGTSDQPSYEMSLNRVGDPPTFVKMPHEIAYCIDGCRLHFLCAFRGRPERYRGYSPLDDQLDPCPSSHAYGD